MYTLQRSLYAVKTQSYTWLNLIKEHNLCARTDGRTLFELIYHNTPIYAVDRQPLFCTFCARAQNVSKQSCHLGPSGPNGKIREKISPYFITFKRSLQKKLNYTHFCDKPIMIMSNIADSSFTNTFCIRYGNETQFILTLCISSIM